MRLPDEVLKARQALLAHLDLLLCQAFGQVRGIAKDWRRREEASLAAILEKTGRNGDKK